MKADSLNLKKRVFTIVRCSLKNRLRILFGLPVKIEIRDIPDIEFDPANFHNYDGYKIEKLEQ